MIMVKLNFFKIIQIDFEGIVFIILNVFILISSIIQRVIVLNFPVILIFLFFIIVFIYMFFIISLYLMLKYLLIPAIIILSTARTYPMYKQCD